MTTRNRCEEEAMSVSPSIGRSNLGGGQVKFQLFYHDATTGLAQSHKSDLLLAFAADFGGQDV